MEWYLKVLKNYVGFSGRARRTEFWMFVLFNIIASVIASIVDRLFGWGDGSLNTGPIALLYSLAVLLPSLAVGVRRLHDSNRSGWWILIGLVPFVGWIVLIVFYAQAGTVGANQFGPDPKGPEVVASTQAPAPSV